MNSLKKNKHDSNNKQFRGPPLDPELLLDAALPSTQNKVSNYRFILCTSTYKYNKHKWKWLPSYTVPSIHTICAKQTLQNGSKWNLWKNKWRNLLLKDINCTFIILLLNIYHSKSMLYEKKSITPMRNIFTTSL